MSNDDKHELQFKLLDYHHRAMETRREVQLRIFLGVVAMYLVLAKGTADSISKVSEPQLLQIWVQYFFGIVFILYTIFTLQVEGWNKADRQKYMRLQQMLWDSSVDSDKPKKECCKEECWCTSIRFSWAGTWPVLTVLLLTIICCIFVGSLKIGS